ncbi:MAG: alkaline phosphatase family protein [Oligoflexia bacterium]|nr:MAG: alkaline phosphatase family protein [Oligoflexia bacterium]
MKSLLILTLLATALYSQSALSVSALPKSKPKLLLVLVYDQFRADYLYRFKDQFLPAKSGGKIGGFRYLMENGAYFPNAEYEVLQCMTCPGHAMILTGSYPYQNKIPLNDFFDRKKNSLVYCTFDDEYAHSPRMLQGSTVGDELKLISPQSKVFALALKDRSGIMLGGKTANLALWMNQKEMKWETSGYYLKSKPDLSWIDQLNKSAKYKKGAQYLWQAQYSKHKFNIVADTNSGEFFGTPFGGEMTTQAALATLEANKLGQGNQTDILAISFSNHDMAGHRYGPNSPEMEEMTLAEDRQLSELLTQINKKIPGGLNSVVIALTADHGVAPMVEYSKSLGLDAGRIDQKSVLEKLNAKLDEQFGKGKKPLALTYKSLNFYIDREEAQQRKLNITEIEKAMKAELLATEGVAHVFTRSEYLAGQHLPANLGKQIAKNYIPDISGDVVVVPKPFWHEVATPPVNHLTGYTYDRTVPLLIVGAAVKGGVYPQNVHVVDLAPTLATLIGTLAPSLSEGRVLHEILDTKVK